MNRHATAHTHRPLAPRRRRRGAVVIYVTAILMALLAVTVLAIDWGRAQLIKTELQAAADAAARAAATQLASGVSNTAVRTAAKNASQQNKAYGTPVVLSNANIRFVNWNTNGTFSYVSNASSANAVEITATRPDVSLVFGQFIGKSTVDVAGRAIARRNALQTVTVTVGGTSDPWLSGMPAGSTASYNDTTTNATPVGVSGITLPPGAMVTFTNITGAVKHGTAASSGPFGPDGKPGSMYSHNADAPTAQPGAQNGIADVVMPIAALMGLFLGPAQPSLTAAPARRDYSASSERDKTTYDDILLKQPFFIGDGLNSSGTVQQFKVPPGATRLYLGPMDGHEWKNNTGSFVVTITLPRTVSMVK